MRLIFLFFFALVSGWAQFTVPFARINTTASVVPITLDASCTGSNSGALTVPCSSAMTVTAGDTITCEGFDSNFDPGSPLMNDIVNGQYDMSNGGVHPNSNNTWVAIGVFFNSAGGSITPQIYNYESVGLGIACQAWKSTRTTLALDTGGVNLMHFATTAAANPTAGTAAAPTNNNEVIVCQVVRASAATTSAGSGYTPTGTLTAITETLAQYFEYQIQSTATAANCPMTSASAKYTDFQIALLNASNPAGGRAWTGMYGAPATAQTNGATVTTAILGGASGSLSPLDAQGAGWAVNSTAPTFDTSIHPVGTATQLLINGKYHLIGDAGASIHFASTDSTSSVTYTLQGWQPMGTPEWFSSFFRLGTNATPSQGCDMMGLFGGLTVDMMLQVNTPASGTSLQWDLENTTNSGTSGKVSAGDEGADIWIQEHVAGMGEQNHQVLFYTLVSGAWTLQNTLNYSVFCGAAAGCSTPTAAATTTGTISTGSTSLTVASGTGIAVGQIVVGTGLVYPTEVLSGSGTSWTLSQGPSSNLSGTTINFYSNLPRGFAVATTGSASANSTALTVASGTSVAPGQAVYAVSGIMPNTFVASVTGTAVTLSQPTSAAITSGTGVSFWNTSGGTLNTSVGKTSSCGLTTGDAWYSGESLDPYNTFGAFAP